MASVGLPSNAQGVATMTTSTANIASVCCAAVLIGQAAPAALPLSGRGRRSITPQSIEGEPRGEGDTVAMPSSAELVTALSLQPHPEGGFFAETHRSQLTVSTPVGNRSALTEIFYLLNAGDHADFHRLQADETWHFYMGVPITIFELDDTAPGGMRRTVLGPDLAAGQTPQYTVQAGTWFGAQVADEASTGDYALMGLSVGWGFDYQDWELGDKASLVDMFPSAATKIAELTPHGDSSSGTTQDSAPTESTSTAPESTTTSSGSAGIASMSAASGAEATLTMLIAGAIISVNL